MRCCCYCCRWGRRWQGPAIAEGLLPSAARRLLGDTPLNRCDNMQKCQGTNTRRFLNIQRSYCYIPASTPVNMRVLLDFPDNTWMHANRTHAHSWISCDHITYPCVRFCQDPRAPEYYRRSMFASPPYTGRSLNISSLSPHGS